MSADSIEHLDFDATPRCERTRAGSQCTSDAVWTAVCRKCNRGHYLCDNHKRIICLDAARVIVPCGATGSGRYLFRFVAIEGAS